MRTSAKIRLAMAMAILSTACHPSALFAQCEALVAMDGLAVISPQGSLIRRLSSDRPSFAVWSPDGNYVAGAFRPEGFRILDATGRVLTRKKDSDGVAALTALKWTGAHLIEAKDTDDAPDLICSWIVPSDVSSAETGFLGAGLNNCALAPNSRESACTRDRNISIGQSMRPGKAVYTQNPFDPSFRMASLEAKAGEVVRSRTEPPFEIRIRPRKPTVIDPKTGIPMNDLSPEIEIHRLSGGGPILERTRSFGPNYELDMDGVQWFFVLNPPGATRTRFRVDIYRDDTHPTLLGIQWAPDASRFFAWETTRKGEALITLTRVGLGWSVKRTPMRMESGTPGDLMLVRGGLTVDPDGKSATVDSSGTVYRCAVEEGVCRPIALRPPEWVDIPFGNDTLPVRVLDWHCDTRQ